MPTRSPTSRTSATAFRWRGGRGPASTMSSTPGRGRQCSRSASRRAGGEPRGPPRTRSIRHDAPMSPLDELGDLLARWESALVRDQLSLDDAIRLQHRLVDVAQRTLGSDVVFEEDYGQARELATVGFGGGGR